ncbi:hypothetical protein EXIGLDRAFT_716781 [Exidia glandulosa HHB12029]|uniref:Uncharacterized protein n=1 Tax=Exidia glandulosa HHB12029 TaxID=1314781 RepID=A0A166MUG5_EXIGL|nr:hypothetical protein EXIGLDRAFT_716781 [Exidia glandulosa HHB12029]
MSGVTVRRRGGPHENRSVKSKRHCKRGRTDEEGSTQVLVLQPAARPYALEAHPSTRDSEQEMRKE